MLKAGFAGKKKKNNKHSGSNLNLSSYTNLPCENFDLSNVVWAWNKRILEIKNAVGKICGKKIDWWSYEVRGVEWNVIRIKSSVPSNVQRYI